VGTKSSLQRSDGPSPTEKEEDTLYQSNMSNTTTQRRQPISKEASSNKDGNGVPSGFVLKLFQMVNGAPDDIISVSYPVACYVILRKKISTFLIDIWSVLEFSRFLCAFPVKMLSV